MSHFQNNVSTHKPCIDSDKSQRCLHISVIDSAIYYKWPIVTASESMKATVLHLADAVRSD